MQGRLQYGAHGSMGEIGHMLIDPDGPECVCGQKGCLEVFAGGEAVLRAVCRRIDEGEKSALENVIACNQQQNTYEMIANAAETGDTLAREEILRAAEYLGIGISHAINTFGPQRIILGGRLVQCSQLMVDRAVATARDHIFNERARDIPITVTKLGDRAVSIGAAILVFQDLFDRGGLAPTTERATRQSSWQKRSLTGRRHADMVLYKD